MEFFGTGSPLGQCQLLVMECKEPLGANVKRLVAFAGRIGLPVTHCDGAFIKIDTLRLLLDELHNSYSIERRRKLVLCGGCLEEQVSVIAQHLLLTGFDVLLIRNLVQESSPDHAHIVIRGKDDLGQDLVITKDYMSHGMRQRTRELVSLELGPELEYDMTLKLAREVNAERFTRLDRSLLKHVDRGFLVISAMPPEDRQTHASHMGRLKSLQSLGLAEERQTGVWQVAPDIENKLRSLGQRGDIIKTMHRAMREIGAERPSGNFAKFDTAKAGNRIVGRVAGIGLTDEINDRHYVVLDGIDGRVHYADVGHQRPEFVPEKSMIIAIENQTSEDDAKTRTRLRILSYLNLERLTNAEASA